MSDAGKRAEDEGGFYGVSFSVKELLLEIREELKALSLRIGAMETLQNTLAPLVGHVGSHDKRLNALELEAGQNKLVRSVVYGLVGLIVVGVVTAWLAVVVVAPK